jgi:hypothetical protein
MEVFLTLNLNGSIYWPRLNLKYGTCQKPAFFGDSSFGPWSDNHQVSNSKVFSALSSDLKSSFKEPRLFSIRVLVAVLSMRYRLGPGPQCPDDKLSLFFIAVPESMAEQSVTQSAYGNEDLGDTASSPGKASFSAAGDNCKVPRIWSRDDAMKLLRLHLNSLFFVLPKAGVGQLPYFRSLQEGSHSKSH